MKAFQVVLSFVALIGVIAFLWFQFAGQSTLPDDAQGRCLYGAEQMIELGEQSLQEPSSRPERTASRRQQVEEWKTRLENGDDPCVVYSDIQKAATTF